MKLKELPGALWHSLRRRLARPRRPAGIPVPVTVTLTSIPSRLHALDIVVKSLLAQATAPERIVVWLREDLRGSVPDRVRRLEGDRVRIRFVPLGSSHKKLVFAVAENPDRVHVTCDDDMIYPTEWLGRLWAEHLRHPGDIIANDVRAVRYDDAGDPLPYERWRLDPDETRETAPEFMSVGWAGVLYPPRCFHPDVTREELFLDLTPRADDLWFKAMSHLAGTRVRRAPDPGRSPIPIPFTQGVALKRANVAEDRNRTQWMALMEAYDLRFDGA